jgi:hypothetical protein
MAKAAGQRRQVAEVRWFRMLGGVHRVPWRLTLRDTWVARGCQPEGVRNRFRSRNGSWHPLLTLSCGGSYKIPFKNQSILGDTHIYITELRQDGTWDGTFESGPHTYAKRGTWSIEEGRLTFKASERKVSSFIGSLGWKKREAVLYDNVKIKEFDEKHKTIYLQSGEILRPGWE